MTPQTPGKLQARDHQPSAVADSAPHRCLGLTPTCPPALIGISLLSARDQHPTVRPLLKQALTGLRPSPPRHVLVPGWLNRLRPDRCSDTLCPGSGPIPPGCASTATS